MDKKGCTHVVNTSSWVDFCFDDGVDVLPLLTPWCTAKTVGIKCETNIRRIWKVARRRQSNEGTQDPRNNIVVSSLGFLFDPYIPEARSLEMSTSSAPKKAPQKASTSSQTRKQNKIVKPCKIENFYIVTTYPSTTEKDWDWPHSLPWQQRSNGERSLLPSLDSNKAPLIGGGQRRQNREPGLSPFSDATRPHHHVNGEHVGSGNEPESGGLLIEGLVGSSLAHDQPASPPGCQEAEWGTWISTSIGQ